MSQAYTIDRPFRVFSFGGGQQSMAVMVMQSLGLVNFDAFVFADVGPRSEDERTQAYVQDYVIPFALKHGIRFEIVRKLYKGEPDDVITAVERAQRSVIIPIRMGSGAPGNRNCTFDFKIRPIHKWVRSEVADGAYVDMGIGFGADEMRRVKDADSEYHDSQGALKFHFMRRKVYPLIEANMNRAASQKLIASVGLPVPPPSSCWFCPFHSRAAWIELKKARPDLFEQAAQLEEKVNETRANVLRDPAFFHPALRPLRDAVGDQMSMFDIFDDDSNCGSGYCGV